MDNGDTSAEWQQPSAGAPEFRLGWAVAYARRVNLRRRWRSVAAAIVIAFAVIVAAGFFLIDNTRAAGASIIATVVALSSFLALGGRSTSRPAQAYGLLARSSAIAIAVGVTGFALAVVLVVLARR